MLDIIRKAIRLNQSLALLPLEAARRLVDDKNTNAKQMIDMTEDLVSIPFVAAAKAIDNSCRPCNTAGDGEHPASTAGGGPALRNIWVNPEVTVFSDVEVRPGERRAVLTVTGLLCGG